MKVRHTFQVTAKCPVNQATDIYECSVYLRELIEVERLLFLTVAFRDVAIFQEDLTQLLADRIGAKVKTTGQHGIVKTVCVCRPRCLIGEGRLCNASPEKPVNALHPR